MLESLHVHNFALLEDVHVNFSSGFNVFTGETGAGKSILIDAFSLVLGGRASADYIRSGAESYWVQAVFDISSLSAVKEILAEHGIETEDDLFIKRQVTAAGKNKAFINGVQIPTAILKKLSGLLVDIHGQHENQALLKPEAPMLLIDKFADKQIGPVLQEYKLLFNEYLLAKRQLAELNKDNIQQEILLDRYSWEIKEIKNAKLVIGEEKALEDEAKILQHSERIISAVDKAYNLLDRDKAVLSLLADAKLSVQSAVRYDEKLTAIFESMDSAWINLDDCRQELADYLESSNFNSQRAAEVQERLDIIYRLQKKYGGMTEDVLQYMADIEVKYNELLNIAEAIAAAEKQLSRAESKLRQKAEQLSSLRKTAAEELSGLIVAHMQDFAMPNAQLTFAFAENNKFTADGFDLIKIVFSANVGEAANDLEKVASGGELSRIALAVKTVMRNKTDVPTMVFDEIDTGVGGVTARKMAEKITAIAAHGQVLCITHLPQIAAFADRHIYIAKQSAAGRTFTNLTILNDDERIEEIARMATGSNNSTAKKNAEELLADARKVKIGVNND